MGETPIPDETQLEATETAGTGKPKNFAKTRKVVRFAVAFDAWKTQVTILGNRLTFPLLRRVLKADIERRRKYVAFTDISDHTLRVSVLSHAFLCLTMTMIFLWSLLTITKGMAALIRFDVYMNVWLFTGIPLAVLTGVRARASYVSYRVMKQELSARSILSPEGK